MISRFCLAFFVYLLLGILLTGPVNALAKPPPIDALPIIVAGAGPSGLLFAQRYLELYPDGKVCIYESKEKDFTSAYDSAFGFGIGERARTELRKTVQGENLVEAVKEMAVVTRSGMWMVNRADLCHVLTRHLQRTCGDRVQITYGAQVSGLQENEAGYLCAKIESKSNDGSLGLNPYSLLVAADGTHSTIRKDLVGKRKLKQKRYLRPTRWKALQLPPQPNLEPGSFLPYPPPGITAYGAIIPRHPNRFVALLFWKPNKAQRNPFDANTPEELKQAMKMTFPNVTVFPSEEELEMYLRSEPGKEYFMKLNRHAVAGQRVALLGDAASGVYSRLGQGCACALITSNLLAEQVVAWKTGDKTLPGALEAFSTQSVLEGHSLADLNIVSAHLGYSRLLRSFDNFSQIAPRINDPSVSYKDILKQNKWRLAIAKMHWLLTRKPVRDGS